MGSRCSGILQKGWKLDYNSDFWLFLYTELFDAYLNQDNIQAKSVVNEQNGGRKNARRAMRLIRKELKLIGHSSK